MRDNAAAPDVKNSAMMEAINFACPEQTYFDRGHDELPDGFYRVLRPAMAFTDRFAQLLFYVKTLNKARVVRGFDPSELYARAAPATVREYRGVVHQHADGYSLVFYHKPPGQFISHIFVSPLASMHGATGFLGFGALGRAEMPGRRRLGRLIMLPLQKGFREAMAQRRQPFYIDEADIEPPIRQLLSLPLG